MHFGLAVGQKGATVFELASNCLLPLCTVVCKMTFSALMTQNQRSNQL